MEVEAIATSKLVVGEERREEEAMLSPHVFLNFLGSVELYFFCWHFYPIKLPPPPPRPLGSGGSDRETHLQRRKGPRDGSNRQHSWGLSRGSAPNATRAGNVPTFPPFVIPCGKPSPFAF